MRNRIYIKKKYHIFCSTFQPDKYSNEFLKKLFEDVYKISLKIIDILYILSILKIESDSLEHFKKIVDDLIHNSMLILKNPNFVDKSNFLDFVTE